MRLFPSYILSCLLFSTPHLINADITYTWTGGGSDNNMNTSANWDAAGIPASSTSSIIVFPTPNTGARYSPVNNIPTTPLVIKTIQFTGALGTPTYTLSGSQFSLGSIDIQTPTVSTDDLTISSNIDIPSSLTLSAVSAARPDAALLVRILSGIISGAGTLTKEGVGLICLSGNNTYSGDTTINAGTLRGEHGNAFGTSRITVNSTGACTAAVVTIPNTLVVNDGGILCVTANAIFSGPITISGTVKLTGTGGTFSGQISGTGAIQLSPSLALAGNGVTLSHANTYSGGTSFIDTTPGSLSLQNSTALGTGSLTLNSPNSSTLFLTLANGVNIANSIDISTSTPALQNAMLVRIAPGDSATISGALSGAGNMSINEPGYTGVLSLPNANASYSGSISLNQGTLSLGNDNSLGTGNLVFYKKGILQLSNSVNIPNNIALHQVGEGQTQSTVFVDTGNAATLSGVITSNNQTLPLQKTGAGKLILTNANTYNGGTTVSAGALEGTTTSLQRTITNNGSVIFNQTTNGTYAGSMSGTGSLTKQGTGTVTLSGTNSYSGGTTVSAGALSGTTDSLQGTITNNSSVIFNQSTDGTYAGSMGGTGALTKQGSGTLILSNIGNSYSGGTTVSAGKLQGNTSTLQGAITNNAEVVFNQASDGTYASNMGGTGVLTKQGSATLILSGTNTYSGGTTVSAGKLQGNTTTLQGAITNNAEVVFNQASDGTYAGSMGGTGVLTKQGVGVLTLTGASNTYSGGTTVSAGKLQGNTSTLQGAITNNAEVVFNQTSDGTYAGSMVGTGVLTKQGSATLVLSGTNTYSGGTTVTAGKLQGDTATLQGAITNNAEVVFNQASDGTYAGSMGGIGVLTKQGGGVLTLTGASNTYSGGTTVSLGALSGSTSTIQGAITNNGSVIFNQISNGTYAGTMGGSGKLVKQGSATLTLTGPNTYSGGTTVSAGALSGSTSNIQGNITNNGSVILNQIADGTYAGSMSGTGSLTKQGVSTILTLSGSNSYSGGTTVSAGSISGNTSSIQGPITNNGIVIFNQSADGTYSGNMDGSGNLTKQGSAALTLTGNNSYTGGNTLEAGTIVVGNSNALGTGTLTMSTGTTLSFNSDLAISQREDNSGTKRGLWRSKNQHYPPELSSESGTLTVANTITMTGAGTLDVSTGTATLSGDVTAGGNVTKTGAGTLILSGSNNYTGAFALNAGTTIVTGALTASSVTANSGATLKGTGTITSSLTNAAGSFVSPGQSIGTLSITGNYIENGTYIAEVDSAGNNDLIAATGNVTINTGTTLDIQPITGGTYAVGMNWEIIHAGGTLTGTYSTLTSPPSYTFAADYTSGNSLVISLTHINSFTSTLSATGNPGAVASYLDALSPTATGDLAFVISELRTLSQPEMIEALNAMHPAPFKCLTLAQQNNDLVVKQALTNRLAGLYQTACPDVCASSEESKACRVKPDSWNLWGSLMGDLSQQDGKNSLLLNGYKTYGAGVVLGADYLLLEHLYLGALAGYTHTKLDWKHTSDRGFINSGYLGLYTTWEKSSFVINGALMGTYSGYQADRKISFATINRTASHHNHAGGLDLHIDGSYLLHGSHNFEVAPFAGLDYVYLHDSGFTEAGADSLDLVVPSKNYNLLRAQAGARFSKCFSISCGNLVPALELGWAREIRYGGKHYTTHLKHEPGSFTVIGLFPNRTLFVPGASITGTFLDSRLSAGVVYNAQVSRHFSDQMLSLQGSWRF